MPNIIHCIYASTSGNVEAVVEKTAQVFRANGLETQLHRSEQTDISVISQNQQFLFATSTWEHGLINKFFVPLLEQMKQEKFEGKQTGLIGLGDNRYEPVFFNTGIEAIREVWSQNGGVQLFRTLKLNGDPYALLDSVVADWAQQITPHYQGGESSEG